MGRFSGRVIGLSLENTAISSNRNLKQQACRQLNKTGQVGCFEAKPGNQTGTVGGWLADIDYCAAKKLRRRLVSGRVKTTAMT